MKRLLTLCAAFIFLLTACSKQPVTNVTTTVENLPTIKTIVGTDKSQTANYQGYINIKTSISEANVKNLKKITVKNVTFGGNENGTPVMYRYNEPFTEKTVNVIYNETKRGNVSNTYTYIPDQFSKFGFEKTADGEYITKIQYLIMQVKPEIKPEDIKRNVAFSMVYEQNNGKVIEKSLNVSIP